MNDRVNLRNIWIMMSAMCSETGMKLALTHDSTAACNGTTMFMPRSWVYTRDPEITDILHGVTIHEAMGHGRFTNFNDIREFFPTASQLGKAIQNIFEDIFIETQCNNAKPGAAAALSKMVSVLAEKGFFGTPAIFEQSSSNKAGLVVSALLNLCRARLLPLQDTSLSKNVAYFEATLETTLGTLWSQIWDVAKEANKIKSTSECIILTQKILALISESASDDSQKSIPSQKSKNIDDSDSEISEGSDCDCLNKPNEQSENSSSGSNELDCDSCEENETELDNTLDQDGTDAHACESAGENDDEEESIHDTQAKKAAQDILSTENSSMPETEISKMASKEISRGSRRGSGQEIIFDESPKKYPVSEKALQIACCMKSISDDLQEALLAETRCIRSNKMVGKRLNSRLLSRIRLANPNVFVRKEVGEGLSTSVCLLIDDSGSMSDKLSSWAQGISFGLGDILDEFEIPFSIAVYSESLGYAKHYETDWSDFKKQRKMVKYGDGTTTGGAVELVLGELSCREEERRLLIVATDGDTCDMERLESAYAEATEQGIEIASIMLGPVIPKIKQLAESFGFEAVSCTNENDLAKYVLDRTMDAI